MKLATFSLMHFIKIRQNGESHLPSEYQYWLNNNDNGNNSITKY